MIYTANFLDNKVVLDKHPSSKNEYYGKDGDDGHVDL